VFIVTCNPTTGFVVESDEYYACDIRQKYVLLNMIELSEKLRNIIKESKVIFAIDNFTNKLLNQVFPDFVLLTIVNILKII